MCNPVLGVALIAGATQAVSAISSISAAKANNRAVNASLAARKREIDLATTQEINNRLREMRREQARIEVASAGAGLSLSSGSIEALLMDSAMQAGLANSTSLANREARKKSADAQAQSQIQSYATPLGAGLQIGLGAGAAYIGASRKSKSANA